MNLNTKPMNSYILQNDNLVLEIAVAGFKESELTVELVAAGRYLVVTGKKTCPQVDVKKFVNRGLSYRNFEERYLLGDPYEVVDARLLDGVLRIEFEQVKKSIKIEIGSKKQDNFMKEDVPKILQGAIDKVKNSSKVLDN